MGSIAEEKQPSIKVEKPTFSSKANTLEYAQSLDAKDHMRRFRDQYIIPSKANIKATKLAKPGSFVCSLSIVAFYPHHHMIGRKHKLIVYQVSPMNLPYTSVEIVWVFNLNV